MWSNVYKKYPTVWSISTHVWKNWRMVCKRLATPGLGHFLTSRFLTTALLSSNAKQPCDIWLIHNSCTGNFLPPLYEQWKLQAIDFLQNLNSIRCGNVQKFCVVIGNRFPIIYLFLRLILCLILGFSNIFPQFCDWSQLSITGLKNESNNITWKARD